MRLFAALLTAGITVSGSAYASSIIIVEGGATSPSSILVDVPQSTPRSIVEIGVPSIDAGKVAAIDAAPKSSGTKMGAELMVIRGGEVGSASPEPAAIAPTSADAAPTQQASAGDQAPAVEPAAVEPQ